MNRMSEIRLTLRPAVPSDVDLLAARLSALVQTAEQRDRLVCVSVSADVPGLVNRFVEMQGDGSPQPGVLVDAML